MTGATRKHVATGNPVAGRRPLVLVEVDMRALRTLPDDDHGHPPAHEIKREMGDAFFALRRMKARLADQPEAAAHVQDCIKRLGQLGVPAP